MATTLQQSSQSYMSHSSSNAGHNLDNNLDALLDDLQTSVARPSNAISLQQNHNSSLINGNVNLPRGATGYREVTTTVTQERNGVPMTSRDYQIEYLNPANSITVAQERSSSPSLELLKNTDLSGKNVASYKTEKYEYQVKSSSRNVDGTSSSYHQQPSLQSIDSKPYFTDGDSSAYQYSKTENFENRNLNQNLNELDSLLKELDSQKSSYTSGMPHPPHRSEHVSRSSETRVERHATTSPGRSYVDTSSPILSRRSQSANRELNYNDFQTSTPRPARASSPGVLPGGAPKVPQRSVNVQREINSFEARTHVSRRDSPSNRDRSVELSPTLRRRTPSPAGEFRPANFSGYPISPKDTAVKTVMKNTYNTYSSNTRRTPTPTSFDDPQPYRSPSPVSFPTKPGQRSPSPVRKGLNRTDSGRTLTYQVSPHHQLSDPNSPTVITYKYSSHSTHHNKYPGTYDEREPMMPRPFPTPSPIPGGEQSPPKKLDDLMATFQDSRVIDNTYREDYYRHHQHQQHQQQQRIENETTKYNTDLQRSPSFERNLRPSSVKAAQQYHPQPVQEVIPTPAPPPPQPQVEKQLSKSVAGPPVYYPPGVELFAKKEEQQMEQQFVGGKGKYKGKGKMKYKYEKSEKSKESSKTGVAAVPVCLPLCCAMPCVIM